MAVRTRRQRGATDIWPGFVDALAALLIIVIFLLMVFTLAQYFLSEALTGRDEALARLNRTVAELQEMLSLEKRSNEELRTNLAQVSEQLQASLADRDRLSSQLAELMPSYDAMRVDLAARTAELAAMATRATAAEERVAKLEKNLADAFKTVEADKEKIEAKLAEIASLMQDLETLRKVRTELEKKVAELAQTLKLSKEEVEKLAKQNAESQIAMTALRDRSKALEAKLSTEQERTALAQTEIEKAETRLKDALARSGVLESELTEEQKMSVQARRQVELLNQQIAALRRQLARLESALEVSEHKSKDQQVQIADLGRRLNLALAAKVEELARYRSEFFGKLREVLGNRKDIQIVGDRFVFQSEVLFTSGSATLSRPGQIQIANVTRILLDISRTIPKKLNWVLRVDGHTDKVPIATARFPSNWELSSQRAISVVKFMASRGVAEDRLVAAGFGEHHPIDARNDEIGYRRNRRIEFKLTQR